MPDRIVNHHHARPRTLRFGKAQQRVDRPGGRVDIDRRHSAHLSPFAPLVTPGFVDGWDESRWPENAAPSTADLDAVLGGRPAYLARVDAHSALASSGLRRLVPGLAKTAGFSAAGPVVGDAHRLVRAAARDLLSGAQLVEAAAAALDAAAASGIVAVHECAGPDIGGLDDWRRLRDTDHGVEVIGYWGHAVSSPAQARTLICETGARGLAGDLFVDGALGSRTAWLREPYADVPDCVGACHLDTDGIAAHVRACTEAGVPPGFHVIGDAAVAAVVTAFERVVDALGVGAVARCGHRVEHLEMVTADQAAKLAGWGVIASVQPNFDALWGGADGMYRRRLGADRASGLNNFALLASQGVPLAFGSDAPVTALNPWEGVRSAAHHRTPGSAPASYAVWDTRQADLGAPGATVGPGFADPPSLMPPLPSLSGTLPRCRQTVHRGVVIYG
ncbi:amidohydrolase family protein [Mycobacterium sp. SM1]|nr:amidohydrolase family protein [Mycobacterium sp. SM1]